MLTSISLAVLLLSMTPPPTAPDDLQPLLSFEDAARVADWRPLHDRVMGGVSSGSVAAVPGAARLAGVLSLERGGGFASFRIEKRYPDLSRHDGLQLRVRGDGQVYKLALLAGEDGISWQLPFETRAGEWSLVDLPFAALTPTWRGRLVRDAGPFDASRVRELGVLIADEQAGPFAIEVATIQLWSAARKGDDPRARLLARARALSASLVASEGAPVAAALPGLVLICEAGELGARASRQRGALLAQLDGLAARGLHLVHLMGEQAGRLAGHTLTPAQVRELRERWSAPEQEFCVLLISESGHVLQRWSQPLSAAAIFARHDEHAARTLPGAPAPGKAQDQALESAPVRRADSERPE